MKGININETITFISSYENNKERPTKWFIAPIDQLSIRIIDDMATEYEAEVKEKGNAKAKTIMQFGRRKIDIVRIGLKGFEAFEDPQTGKDIEFETIATARFGKSRNVVSDEIVKMIPIIDELADAIEKISRLSPDEIKN